MSTNHAVIIIIIYWGKVAADKRFCLPLFPLKLRTSEEPEPKIIKAGS
jgi:hypothetical protein